MNKRIKTGLFCLLAFVLLVSGLRLYPILADDDQLIFTPSEVFEPKNQKGLLLVLRDVKSPLKLTKELEVKIEQALNEPNQHDLMAAVRIIRKLQERGEKLPPNFTDSSLLLERFVLSLKNEIFLMYRLSESEDISRGLLLSGVDDSEFKKKADYFKLKVLETFTYQKRKTFNTLWSRVEAFERNPDQGIEVDVHIREFGYDNFFGKFFLACVTPTVSKQVELIMEIGSNQSGDDNSE